MYRWSTGWDPSSDAWRNMSISEISQQPGRGLAFEIIALRDIAPGEEVTVSVATPAYTAFDYLRVISSLVKNSSSYL